MVLLPAPAGPSIVMMSFLGFFWVECSFMSRSKIVHGSDLRTRHEPRSRLLRRLMWGRPPSAVRRWHDSLSHLLRCPPEFPEFPHTQGIMPLCQTHTSLVADQITMIEVRHRKPEGTIEQDLPRRRLEQIRSADNLRDSHGGVVDNHGQLIGRHIIPAPDNKIPEVLPSNDPLRPKMQIGKPDLFPARHKKPPIDPGRLLWPCRWHVPCRDGRRGRPAKAKPSGLWRRR